MTRLESLYSYSTDKVYRSWQVLGENKISEQTGVYTEGMLYLLEVGSRNKNSLIYCKKELIGHVFWDNMKLEDFDLGEVSFQEGIISPNFIMLLMPNEYNACKEKENEGGLSYLSNWYPFVEEENEYSKVHIDDSDYRLCIRCLGAPFVTDDELEYTKGEIIDLAIRPALERYFKYFPKTEIVCEAINGTEQKVQFPENAYDVIHFSVQQRGASGAGMITNPLLRYWDEGMYSGGFGASINGHYHGTYAPKTQTSTFGSYALGRAAQQAVVNYRTRYHLDKVQEIVPPDKLPDGIENTPENRRKFGEKKWFLRFYSNKGGIAEIHFAVHSLDFNDVEFARRPELINLCNAEVKKLFGNLRRQVKSDIPGTVDYSTWITEANESINQVEENWKSIVKYSSIIRGSL